MNLARARRRWIKMFRWEDQVIRLCGDAHKAIPSEEDAYNERARWFNRRYDNPRAKPRRYNRKRLGGWRWRSRWP